MIRYIATAIVLLLCGSLGSRSLQAQQRIAKIDFSLPASDGNVVRLSDSDAEFHVLCFLGTECPLARIYGPRLDRMAKSYADRGVSFFGVNSNVQDSMEDLQRYVSEHQLTFPVVKDFDRSVALMAGATRTPEVVVIDRDSKVRYRGRIDDQYQPGIARSKATKHELINAIDQLLAGEDVETPTTEAEGCLIALPRKADANCSVTFCSEVIRVLQRNCIDCHRQGEIGPFSLTEYDEVVGWGDMMIEVIEDQRMPPWHASPDHGEFANARHMSDEDKQTLKSWVDGGMPYGDAKQMPALRTYTSGWRLPKEPDVVFEMHRDAFSVPADGTVEYQYFVVDPKFETDKWITAAELIPGNRAVVHHAIAFTRPPDGASFRSIGLLAGYVPGQIVSPLPDGYARRVPAGSRIVFQMHYTPNGKPQQDKTRIGLVFADETEVTHEVYALGGIEQEFEIPPHAANHQVTATIRGFPRDGQLLSIMPHMHLRGKSFEFFAKSDTENDKLLSVPAYDFNWQHNYELTEPLDLGSVRELRFNATFDNSADNPTNPDPSEYVTWGDQTWQEMALAFVAVAEPRVKSQRLPRDETLDKELAARRQATLERANKYADEYIAKFDQNDDRHLSKYELPDSVRMFYFRRLDQDRDELVSHREIRDQAYERLSTK